MAVHTLINFNGRLSYISHLFPVAFVKKNSTSLPYKARIQTTVLYVRKMLCVRFLLIQLWRDHQVSRQLHYKLPKLAQVVPQRE